MKNIRKWIVLAGLLAAGVGLPYVLGFFGPTEAEVRNWGSLAVILGVLVAVFSRAKRRIQEPVLFVTAVIQLPPAILWFVFHGYGISDGSTPSSFVAHWGFAIPHILVVAVAGRCLYLLRQHKG